MFVIEKENSFSRLSKSPRRQRFDLSCYCFNDYRVERPLEEKWILLAVYQLQFA
jgi:hypothetical protein